MATRRLKIGIDGRMLGWGGVGRYTKGLIEGLQSLDTEHRFFIICNSGHCFDNLAPNFKIKVIDQPVFSNMANLSLSRLLNSLDIDVFHSPHFIYPWFLKGRGIATVHDLIPYRFPKTMFLKDRLKFKAAVRLTLRKANHVIAVSGSTKKDIVELLGHKDSKISIIYEGIDRDFTGLIEKDSFPPELPQEFLLYVGAFRLHKNINGILESYKNLPPDIKEKYPLVFVGKEDPRYLDFTRIVRQSGLEQNVIRLENVSEDELVSIYKSAKLLLMPSFYEGFGLPALESMRCGTPVIASNLSSFPEILGDSAILADPYDVDSISKAILLLLNNQEKYEFYVNKGLEKAATYSWSKAARETLEVYEKVALCL